MKVLRKTLAVMLALCLGLGAVPALAASEPSMEALVLMDNDDVTVTLTDYDPEGDWGPTFELLMENKGSRDLRFNFDDVSVDGVMREPTFGGGDRAARCGAGRL